MVTTSSHLLLSILTADCAPILLADPVKNIVAACHAGWRGALSGIIDNTIQKMCQVGASTSNIIAAIGPMIAPEDYEVDQGFYDQFLEENTTNKKFFSAGRTGHKKHFDLRQYIVYKMHNINIFNIEHCSAEKLDLFSHRRHNATGRQISVIKTP